MIQIKRLGEKVICPRLPRLQSLNRAGNGRKGGNHDEGRRFVQQSSALQELQTVGIGKSKIADDQVKVFLFEQKSRLFGGLRSLNLKLLLFEFLREQISQTPIVFH